MAVLDECREYVVAVAQVERAERPCPEGLRVVDELLQVPARSGDGAQREASAGDGLDARAPAPLPVREHDRAAPVDLDREQEVVDRGGREAARDRRRAAGREGAARAQLVRA